MFGESEYRGTDSSLYQENETDEVRSSLSNSSCHATVDTNASNQGNAVFYCDCSTVYLLPSRSTGTSSHLGEVAFT